MSDESEEKADKPLDPFDPEVIARSNRAILVGLQRPEDTPEEAQLLLDELHELVSNVGVEIRGDGRLAGWSWIGHRAITGDREWQATSFDSDGPVGDCRRADIGVALDDQGAAGAVVALVALE